METKLTQDALFRNIQDLHLKCSDEISKYDRARNDSMSEYHYSKAIDEIYKWDGELSESKKELLDMMRKHFDIMYEQIKSMQEISAKLSELAEEVRVAPEIGEWQTNSAK